MAIGETYYVALTLENAGQVPGSMLPSCLGRSMGVLKAVTETHRYQEDNPREMITRDSSVDCEPLSYKMAWVVKRIKAAELACQPTDGTIRDVIISLYASYTESSAAESSVLLLGQVV